MVKTLVPLEDRVDIHQNARTTPASRALLVARVLDDQMPVSRVAAGAGVAAAYGWPADLSDEDALRELSALNGGGR